MMIESIEATQEIIDILTLVCLSVFRDLFGCMLVVRSSQLA